MFLVIIKRSKKFCWVGVKSILHYVTNKSVHLIFLQKVSIEKHLILDAHSYIRIIVGLCLSLSSGSYWLCIVFNVLSSAISSSTVTNTTADGSFFSPLLSCPTSAATKKCSTLVNKKWKSRQAISSKLPLYTGTILKQCQTSLPDGCRVLKGSWPVNTWQWWRYFTVHTTPIQYTASVIVMFN